MARSRIDCALKAQDFVKRLVLVGLGLVVHGCRPSDLTVGSGLDVRPPGSWKAANLSFRPVPGMPIAAWTGPLGSSLVVYSALPIPGGMPASIATALANRLTNLPGIEIKSQRVKIIDGRPLAWVEIIGPGTGDSLAPSGTGKPMPPPGKSLVSTREVILGLPRSDETLYFSWGFPESARRQLLPEIEATIASLHFPRDGNSSSNHRY